MTRRLRIVEWYYGLHGEPLNDRQIGEELGITKGRVNQLRHEAMWRLCEVQGWDWKAVSREEMRTRLGRVTDLRATLRRWHRAS
jgi:hypothetical protein